MIYSEIVKKLRNKELVSKAEITGYQLFMLLQDGEIKQLHYKDSIFEINFIPINYTFEPIEINIETCATFKDAEKLLEHFFHCYEVNKNIYIHIEEEYFQIVLEVLETK